MPYIPVKKPEKTNGEQKQPQATGKQNRRMYLLLGIFSVFLIVYGSVSLIRYTSELAESRNTSRELQEIHEQSDPETSAPETKEATAAPAQTVTPEEKKAAAETTAEIKTAETPAAYRTGNVLEPVPYPDNPELKVSDRFRNLRRKSGYIIGWLSMDGLEEAVALKDNAFFLDHDATGKKNSNGAIFLDDGISLLTRPYTIFLYGHNMKSGNMFGRLKRYKDTSYCFSHRIITFDSLYEEGKYAVFATAQINTVPGTGNWYDIWSLNTNDRTDREKAIRMLAERSVYGNVLDVSADDQILILVTCVDGETERLIVAARRLREGESENNLNMKKPT